MRNFSAILYDENNDIQEENQMTKIKIHEKKCKKDDRQHKEKKVASPN